MNTLHSKICAQRAREMLRDPVKLFAKHRQTQTNTRQHRRYIWVNDAHFWGTSSKIQQKSNLYLNAHFQWLNGFWLLK